MDIFLQQIINGVVLGAAGITNAAAAVVLVRANRRRVVRCAQIFSRDAFEVGAEVRTAFIAHSPQAAQAFSPLPDGKWLADLPQLARQRLQAAGVPLAQCSDSELCTVIERDQFFSYRRDACTGRMASVIWLD